MEVVDGEQPDVDRLRCRRTWPSPMGPRQSSSPRATGPGLRSPRVRRPRTAGGYGGQRATRACLTPRVWGCPRLCLLTRPRRNPPINELRGGAAGCYQPRSRHSRQVRALGAEGRVVAVAGVEPRVVGEPVEDLGGHLVEELGEGVGVAEGVADPAGEQRVAGEEVRVAALGGRVVVEQRDRAGGVAGEGDHLEGAVADGDGVALLDLEGDRDAGLLGDRLGVGDRRRRWRPRWRRRRRPARGGGPSAGGW